MIIPLIMRPDIVSLPDRLPTFIILYAECQWDPDRFILPLIYLDPMEKCEFLRKQTLSVLFPLTAPELRRFPPNFCNSGNVFLMLRTPLLRTFLRRQFSTSSTVWSTQRPPLSETVSEKGSEPTPAPVSQITQDTQAAPSQPSEITRPTVKSSEGEGVSPSYNWDILKERVRQWAEQGTITLRNRADDFTARSKTTFSQLGAHLNKVTGYEEIETLKRGVAEQGIICILFFIHFPNLMASPRATYKCIETSSP